QSRYPATGHRGFDDAHSHGAWRVHRLDRHRVADDADFRSRDQEHGHGSRVVRHSVHDEHADVLPDAAFCPSRFLSEGCSASGDFLGRYLSWGRAVHSHTALRVAAADVLSADQHVATQHDAMSLTSGTFWSEEDESSRFED